jgi:heme a synthase
MRWCYNARMQTLAWLTVGLTYFLMVWGNIVSSTGSGLACPDWPLCHGSVTPPVSAPVVLEWGHRLLAASATFMILLTLYKTLTPSNQIGSPLRRSGKSLLALLAIQILLGGTTVLLGLSPGVSTIHLIIATLVFSGLITVACVTTWKDPVIVNANPKISRLAIAGLMGLLVQFAMGALVRHTHSGLACPNFPHCLEGFFPIPATFGSHLAFFHRWWGVLLLGVFVHLAVVAAKTTPALSRPARRALGLAVAQVILGIGTVLSGLNTESRAIHAAVGYALWGVLFFITLRSGGMRWLWDKTQSTTA